MNYRPLRDLLIAAIITTSGMASMAESIAFKANLTSSSEVPPKETSGTGTLTASLDTQTHVLKYHVVYSGLTGQVTAAHFHGPAAEGVNAKPQVPVKGPFETIDGSATITSEQEKDLLEGKWYFNLHTAANPGGWGSVCINSRTTSVIALLPVAQIQQIDCV